MAALVSGVFVNEGVQIVCGGGARGRFSSAGEVRRVCGSRLGGATYLGRGATRGDVGESTWRTVRDAWGPPKTAVTTEPCVR